MKYLYKIPLDESRQTAESASLKSQLAEAGLLEGGGSVVDQLSSGAADLTLNGQFKPPQWHAQMHAEELEELADSSLEALPLFRDDGRYAEAGYYEISSASSDPAQANARGVYEWTLELTEKGTRNKHWRAIEPNRRQADHEFGNSQTALVGIPAAATKTLWFDAETGDRDVAEPAETQPSEFGDVDLYDLEDGDAAVGGSELRLIYDIAYTDDSGAFDCKIYETFGVDEKYISNEDGRVRVWEAVFDTAHDPSEGEVVMDNALLRLYLDEQWTTLEVEDGETHTIPEGTTEIYSETSVADGGELVQDGDLYTTGEPGYLAAERWDADAESWTDVGLDPHGWGVFDIDVQSIGMVRDEVQLTFVNGTDLFALDVILQAGHSDVLIDLPDGQQGPIPDGLESWLSEIAAETLVDANARKTLISRNEVSR